MRTNTTLFYLVTVIIAGGLVYGAVNLRGIRSEQARQVKAPIAAPWALHSAEVQLETVVSGFPALATKQADSEVFVSPQISGAILLMGPREGEAFQPGTVLAQIDSSEIEDQIAALESDLDSAIQQETFQKRELERQDILLKKGVTTEERRENVRTVYIAARNKVKSLTHQISGLETRRGYAVISARQSGIVAARMAEPGDQATPGKAIYQLSISGDSRFTVKVPQDILKKVHIGSKVVLGSGDNTITAYFTRIHPMLDDLSMGSADVDLSSSPFNLPVGARISARVITRETPNSLTVPITAIAWSADVKFGFVVKTVKAGDTFTLKRIPVEIIHAADKNAVINGELKPGDRVVIAQQAVLLKLKTGEQAVLEEGLSQ